MDNLDFDIREFNKSKGSHNLEAIAYSLYVVSTRLKERVEDLFVPLHLMNDTGAAIVAHAKALRNLEEQINELKEGYAAWGFTKE